MLGCHFIFSINPAFVKNVSVICDVQYLGNIHRESEKNDTRCFITTLANVNRFTKIFHHNIPEEMCYIQ